MLWQAECGFTQVPSASSVTALSDALWAGAIPSTSLTRADGGNSSSCSAPWEHNRLRELVSPSGLGMAGAIPSIRRLKSGMEGTGPPVPCLGNTTGCASW